MSRGAQEVLDGLTAVPYSSNDPEAILAAITKRDMERYEQDYKPVENTAIASLDDMSIIDDAQERVSNSQSITRSKARAEREADRYGFRRTAAQRANADVNLGLNKATGDADIMNEARLNQFDRNRGFRNQLINVGRGVSGQAAQGLGDAASMQTQRENANRAAKASAKAQQTSLLGTLGAAALIAFV